MRLRQIFVTVALLATATVIRGADPTATHYTFEECEGTYMPYQAPASVAEVPDSLEAVMVNHVGRHGARFASSDKNVKRLLDAISRAESAGTLTAVGRDLKALCNTIIARTAGRWGALDSLGEAEQRGLATRMLKSFPGLFGAGGRVDAVASYSPRCIMSMYSFAHQMSRMNNRLEIYTNSGRQNSPMMRPFDTDADYKAFIETDAWLTPLTELTTRLVTASALERALGTGFDAGDDDLSELALAEYLVVAGCRAAGVDVNPARFFTIEEYNNLWNVNNLKHYLQYSSSTLTTATAEMAAPLLRELILTTQAAVDGETHPAARLRFGHAETLMPLVALMHLPGCYYMTNYFDTVALHWRDFYVVPMAANLRMVLFRHKKTGEFYLRVDLNEIPVPLLPGRAAIYTSWPVAREYLTRCLPLIMQ